MIDQEAIIDKCRQMDRRAQRVIYDRYAPTMLGVCRRYVKDEMDAENVMSEGFYKVFTKIGQYGAKGSFEGWIRKIMVNESLAHLRKRHDFNVSLETSNISMVSSEHADSAMNEGSILDLLKRLPSGYRTIFNLYAIEGYKHHEIADMLGISINTSKSQLIKARKRLQTYLNDEKSIAG